GRAACDAARLAAPAARRRAIATAHLRPWPPRARGRAYPTAHRSAHHDGQGGHGTGTNRAASALINTLSSIAHGGDLMAHKTAARTHASRAIARAPSSDRAVAAPRLFRTKNDIPEATRVQVIGLLNQRLADAIDLQTQCKQAHWNVKGPSFIALHELFDDVDEAVEGYIDLIAERVVQLGGVAEGTARVVAERSALDVYPLVLSNGLDHVDALSNALATFGRTVRLGIEEMDELSDADSADILTEVSRGVDKYLWFVEAHQQRDPDLDHAGNGRGK